MAASCLPHVQGGVAFLTGHSAMNSNQATYTMPLKQLLKLLETTADDAPHDKRRASRRWQESKPSSVVRLPEENAR